MSGTGKTLKGFFLGETLLSVLILLVGILPIVGSMKSGFQTSVSSRDIVVATGLAQEGVELLKNVKDNSSLSGHASLGYWLPGSGSVWNDCRIDYNDSVLTNQSSKISCNQTGLTAFVLSQSSSSSPFEHNGGSGKFRRKLLLSYDSANEVVDCVSAVYWGTGYEPTSLATAKSGCNPMNKCVYAETRLTPWQ